MAETQDITQISVNGTLYSVGGGNDSPFTLTENNGAQMSACTSTGQYAVAEGSGTTASGRASHAEGHGTSASGYYSHAEGSGTTASGDYSSHAEGQGTTASSSCSHAEGYKTKAYGHDSHAEGSGTTASGMSSHAEGVSTKAHGYGSHTEGSATTAIGQFSHAEGSVTTASGLFSHAEGYRTTATTQSEHASGQFNISLSGSSTWGYSGNTLFTVGNGSGSSTTHNAFEIRQDGTIYISDTSAEGEYYRKPMIKLQDALKNSGGDVDLQALINRISELETKVATLITKSEVEKGFNNVITVVDNNKLRIRNNALEDE